MNFMSAKIPTFSPRTLWISATLGGLLCISGAVALYARSSTPSPSAPISPAALWPEHVRIAVKDPAVEGQPLALALTLLLATGAWVVAAAILLLVWFKVYPAGA
mgnify:CR=1 FL=1